MGRPKTVNPVDLKTVKIDVRLHVALQAISDATMTGREGGGLKVTIRSLLESAVMACWPGLLTGNPEPAALWLAGAEVTRPETTPADYEAANAPSSYVPSASPQFEPAAMMTTAAAVIAESAAAAAANAGLPDPFGDLVSAYYGIADPVEQNAVFEGMTQTVTGGAGQQIRLKDLAYHLRTALDNGQAIADLAGLIDDYEDGPLVV